MCFVSVCIWEYTFRDAGMLGQATVFSTKETRNSTVYLGQATTQDIVPNGSGQWRFELGGKHNMNNEKEKKTAEDEVESEGKGGFNETRILILSRARKGKNSAHIRISRRQQEDEYCEDHENPRIRRPIWKPLTR